MKRLLLALTLLLLPSLAMAQCNGVFPNNTLCGNVSGAGNLPRPVPNNVLTGVPGGTNGQIQYNNNGVFGGATFTSLFTAACSLSPSTCNFILGYTNVRWWGAVCDGSTLDTTPINNAIASGATSIYIPAFCNITALNALPSGVRLYGANRFSSVLQTINATGTVLPISNAEVEINNLGFVASVPRTSGSYIDITASDVTINSFYMLGAATGITVHDGANIVSIDDADISGTISTGTSIQVGTGTASGPCALKISRIVANASPSGTRTQLAISNLCDAVIENNQFLSSQNLLINPGTGQQVDSLNSAHNFYDSAVGVSVNVVPSGSGVFQRSGFLQDWFESTNGFDVQLAPTGTGAIDGVDFTASTFVNGTIGFVISKGTGTTIANINVDGNKMAGSSTACLYLANFDSALIQNNIIGTAGGLASCNIGIDFVSSAISHANIKNNDLANSITAINGLSTVTSSNVQITGNQGYNPVGATAAITMGASPFTVPAGPSPETHYLNQSATNTATCTQGGQRIAALSVAATYYPVQLGPNESYVCTWTTTAPTYTKFVH